jgi:hypothetical protein
VSKSRQDEKCEEQDGLEVSGGHIIAKARALFQLASDAMLSFCGSVQNMHSRQFIINECERCSEIGEQDGLGEGESGLQYGLKREQTYLLSNPKS